MKRHAAAIIAAILLLLPVLYVGSYLALVVPYQGPVTGKVLGCGFSGGFDIRANYRIVITSSNSSGRLKQKDHVAPFYWPLEQIDRKLRPAAWVPHLPPID